MKNILITGGTGFVGSNLAAALVTRGHTVRILRREHSDLRAINGLPVEHRFGDIRDPGSLLAAMEGCDTVFHAAAMVSFKARLREEQRIVNVVGTGNVVDACLQAGVKRLVHVSSIAAIGFRGDGQPADEGAEFDWGTGPGYKLSKRLGEDEVRRGIAGGLDAVIVNPSVIVGERDIHFHGGQLIRDIIKKRIPFYIQGGMNVVYVGDVVRGMIQAALQGRTGERYILGGENLTHKDIFTRTAGIVGGMAPFARLPLPLLKGGAAAIERICTFLRIEPIVTPDLVRGAGRLNWFSSDKAKRELGYTITPFDEAIRAAYQWYRARGFL